MRLLVDLRSHLSAPSAPEIIQAQRVPAIGDTTVINGKYAIPLPLDVDFPSPSRTTFWTARGRLTAGMW